MTEASILAVMPSSNASFKIGVPGRTLGAVTGDFNSGILGKIGESPRVIPVEIVLNHLERREELRFEILDALGLTPVLAATVAMNSMESLGRTSGPSTIRITTEIKLADGRSVSAPSVQAGFSPPLAVAGSVARLVGLLYGNPFEPVNLAGITIEISLGDAIEAAFLEDVSVPSGTHHPGDRLPVTLGLRDFRGVTWKHELDLELPGDLPPGTYRLMACDGAQATRLEQERAPGTFVPRNLDQLIELMTATVPNDHLVLRILGDEQNPVVGGRELPRLPSSLRPVVSSPNVGGRSSEAGNTVLLEQTENMGKVILGCEILSFTLDHRN
jgi:hypothetical protein